MQILGKMIGGSLGFMMAGPFGAIIGLIIGNMFDKGLSSHMSQPYNHFFNEKRTAVSQAFIKTSACLMGFFAKADGRVSEKELEYANSVFHNFKIDDEQILQAQEWFTTSKNGQISLKDQIRMLQYLKEKNLFLCKYCLDITYQMIKIDGLNSKKIHLLNQVLTELGFAPIETIFNPEDLWEEFKSQQRSSHQYQRYQQRPPFSTPQNTTENAFKTLNLPSSASQTEVKKAYRRLMSQYHPDKMMAKGASELDIQKATEKTQEISKAYEQICSVKGWS
ncbi:MAG TPA: co-chaperone DjlA [Legionellales bacterium]|nr:co-chaperone DjlA [Legionellales bacterium]